MRIWQTLFLAVSGLSLIDCSGRTDNTEASKPAQTSPAAQEQSEAVPPAPVPTPQAAVRPTIQTYDIIAAYPHDVSAFTQGLFFWNGILYESTGRHGESTVRKTVIETGEITEFRDIPPEYFGEGITRWQDKIIALTWQSGLGFVMDIESLTPLDVFGYPGEGWGLTANETHLIQSDGSNVLRFLDPETFKITRTLNVNINGKPLNAINELEWIEGEIWANVWRSDLIARIDPDTGNVTAVVDMSNLFPISERKNADDDVLNGIAHDPETGRLFVTGKHWPNLYEIRVKDIGLADE